MNKYETWYTQITESAKTRIKDHDEYYENHHIIPSKLGGPDTPENRVDLTAREHFICHWLLIKFTEGNARYKMVNALRMMRAENPNQQRYNTKITARVYEKLKKEYAEMQSKERSGKGNGMYGKKHSDEAKRKISEANKGERNGAKQPQARKKIAESKKGKKRPAFSKEWRQKLSESSSGENNSMYGKTHSEEAKRKMSEKAKQRKQSDETRKKIGLAQLGSKRKKKRCPHCGRDIAVNGYARFHGDKCKEKK